MFAESWSISGRSGTTDTAFLRESPLGEGPTGRRGQPPSPVSRKAAPRASYPARPAASSDSRGGQCVARATDEPRLRVPRDCALPERTGGISTKPKTLETLGFQVVRTGNHIALLRNNPDGTTTPLTIPELKGSTLRAICTQAGIPRQEFLRVYEQS